MAVDVFAIGALIDLSADVDPAAVGAAVTVELCGHWEHEGACRWPHNSAIDATSRPARFRTLYVADADEAQAVQDRIRQALGSSPDWTVVAVEGRPVDGPDEELAQRLLRGPRA
jgi:hypothetical protein